MNAHTYIPQDRRRALARGETLPDRTAGSALFADISGFTPLTERLTQTLGTRRGAEELTWRINAVYDALITALERHGGSVISFAGDAITCWFDMPHSALRAVSCGHALQVAVSAFPDLSLRVAITTGAARRFVVGDPGIQLLDALAGATVARLAVADHLAQKGEVVADASTVAVCGEMLRVDAWRLDTETQQRFAVVAPSASFAALPGTPETVEVSTEVVRAWVLPAVYEREQSGHGAFLTELRPAVALFLHFAGIDYDGDDTAGAKLDLFIQRVQGIVTRNGGFLTQFVIGDKGSYLLAVFGAPVAHEDDARRGVQTALALRALSQHLPFVPAVRSGISQGVMRAGTYGSATRCVYSVQGDEVNLAARLMSTAVTGEILVSGYVQKAVANQFVFEPRPPLPLKGKAEPLPVFAVTGERQHRAIRLQEPTYASPMVGRQAELQIINAKLDLTLNGKSQVIGIVSEAGMGKSRLVAEVIRSARKMGFAGYGGACQSDATNTPYQTWKSIWAAFFDVDPSASSRKQTRSLEGEVEDRAPERLQALPLLSIVLNLEIPDNEFTKSLEPKLRQSALHALLEDCLRAGAKDEPLLIVIEDIHWIDALSHALLEDLARALIDCPVCFVLAYRPPKLARLVAPRLEALPNFSRIELSELNATEAEQVIRAKLAQLYPARGGAVPAELVEKLMARAQGNPFFLEELLNFLHDRGLDPREPQALEKIDLPDSLHTLILSRIDQLSEREKTTLRVASIVGRLFRAVWLTGYYPDLGGLPKVKADLEQLAALDITPLDSPEPELAYLFKHIVTQEVTYESLPFATRAHLHEQLADYLERQIAAEALVESSLLDTLVYHYTRSDNQTKQREYLRKAGKAALAVGAINTAAEYLTRLLELTPDPDPTRSALALQLAGAFRRLGDFPAARAAIGQAQAAATTDADRAAALAGLGGLTSELGDYATAQAILTEAVPLARASGDRLTLCRALFELGGVNWRLDSLDAAKIALDESLTLAPTLGDPSLELSVLNRLGVVADMQGKFDEGERLYTEVHMRAVAIGDRWRAMSALNNLGESALVRNDYATSRENFQKALTIAREIGGQKDIAIFLINLADSDIKLGDLRSAHASLREGLALAQRLGALPVEVVAVTCFADLAYARGETEQALAFLGLARNHPAWTREDQHNLELTLARWALGASVVEAGLAKGAEEDWDATVQELLKT